MVLVGYKNDVTRKFELVLHFHHEAFEFEESIDCFLDEDEFQDDQAEDGGEDGQDDLDEVEDGGEEDSNSDSGSISLLSRRHPDNI